MIGVHRLKRFVRHQQLNRNMRVVDEVEGMISISEAQLLYDMASKVDAQHCIVEVGSYRGRSTTALSLGSRDNGVTVYAIEPHKTFEGVLGGHFGSEDRAAFYRNMLKSGSWQNVALVNLSSEQVAPCFVGKVGLLFIDGDHTTEGVLRDWDCWRDKLVPTAQVAFDDATNEQLGPYKLLSHLLNNGWEEVVAVGKIKVIERNSI